MGLEQRPNIMGDVREKPIAPELMSGPLARIEIRQTLVAAVAENAGVSEEAVKVDVSLDDLQTVPSP